MTRSAWILGVWIAVCAFVSASNQRPVTVTQHIICWKHWDGEKVQATCEEPIAVINGGR